jgi:hypothetical protein
MNKPRGYKGILAASCLAAFAFDSALAQDTVPATDSSQPGGSVPSGADRGTTPGWLLGGGKRPANPFRAPAAPVLGQAVPTPPQARPLPPGIRPLSKALAAKDVPENATANPLGEGWTCNSGFRRAGTSCVAVQIPANATLDFSGHGWMCNSGFQRQAQRCVAISVPENASLDPSGARWACNYGFRRQGQSCAAIVVPENASLDTAGHSWVCKAGFQQRERACIDDDTARLQKQADQAVNARPGGQAPPGAATGKGPVSVTSGENRQGRTSKARVVIGRF